MIYLIKKIKLNQTCCSNPRGVRVHQVGRPYAGSVHMM